MNRTKVLAAPSPYIELFGVDGMGKGRPGIESRASALLPQNDLPPLELVGDKETAIRIRRAAAGRTMTALRAIFSAEYRRVYRKEMLHLALAAAKERGVELTPELAKKYGVELPGKGVRRVGVDAVDNRDGVVPPVSEDRGGALDNEVEGEQDGA